MKYSIVCCCSLSVLFLNFFFKFQEIALLKNSAEKCWSAMELELIREGGIWGPDHTNILEKWMLDDIEGDEKF